MRLLALSLFSIALTACAADPQPPAEKEPEAKTEYGAVLSTDITPLPASDLLATYSTEELTDTVATAVSGTVAEVCQAKGCWMTLPTGGGESMMVKFKDYGFFVPMDLGGKEVIMDGIAYYEVVPVDELRHLAEDGGQSAEAVAAITEPRRELRFLADGVRVK
ncbi:DUF4920 domain-containing protein [Lewinella sp. IMCC34183]|uniref:DUF4920 domain-containing protein n=1 Tax=Lewinella sp. IMCC34183 TaxID=2248762 RepID=UPI000E23EA4A|nr:DUF4920 domain-containing protein [Lewinella sp. IMCC34183]